MHYVELLETQTFKSKRSSLCFSALELANSWYCHYFTGRVSNESGVKYFVSFSLSLSHLQHTHILVSSSSPEIRHAHRTQSKAQPAQGAWEHTYVKCTDIGPCIHTCIKPRTFKNTWSMNPHACAHMPTGPRGAYRPTRYTHCACKTIVRVMSINAVIQRYSHRLWFLELCKSWRLFRFIAPTNFHE